MGATEPQAAAVQPAPVNDHVTPWFAESFVTVAVNAWVAFTARVAVVADSVTATPVGAVVKVIVVIADFVVSATDVAVKVTVAGFGAAAGAV